MTAPNPQKITLFFFLTFRNLHNSSTVTKGYYLQVQGPTTARDLAVAYANTPIEEHRGHGPNRSATNQRVKFCQRLSLYATTVLLQGGDSVVVRERVAVEDATRVTCIEFFSMFLCMDRGGYLIHRLTHHSTPAFFTGQPNWTQDYYKRKIQQATQLTITY